MGEKLTREEWLTQKFFKAWTGWLMHRDENRHHAASYYADLLVEECGYTYKDIETLKYEVRKATQRGVVQS